MKTFYFYDTVIGRIGLVEDHEKLVHLFLPGEKYTIPQEAIEKETTFLKSVKKELDEYLNGTRTEFTIPCHPEGTIFQKKVWNALMKIPYGTTVSYQDIARSIGNVKASRAVGMANHHNPIPIIIPCHRVIGKTQSLVGYGGGLPLKITLLKMEGIKVQDNRISCNK